MSLSNYRDSANWSELFRVRNEFGILAGLDNLDSALVMIGTRFRWSESFRSRQLRIPAFWASLKVSYRCTSIVFACNGYFESFCLQPELDSTIVPTI